jgi:cbb3-type cytochrome oxidase maturation protein
MAVIYLLLGISVFMAFFFLLAFLWNLRSGQYEDDYSPAWRILFEEKSSKNTYEESENKENQ